MRLRSSTLMVRNPAMDFKLDMDQGIYICCEQEDEIIISTKTGYQRGRLLQDVQC